MRTAYELERWKVVDACRYLQHPHRLRLRALGRTRALLIGDAAQCGTHGERSTEQLALLNRRRLNVIVADSLLRRSQ